MAANVNRMSPLFEIEVGPVSFFEAERYDVLKFDAESEGLVELNQRLAELPNTQTHDEFHPHLTVAYVQKG
jgi:2'-5' RNA ligase